MIYVVLEMSYLAVTLPTTELFTLFVNFTLLNPPYLEIYSMLKFNEVMSVIFPFLEVTLQDNSAKYSTLPPLSNETMLVYSPVIVRMPLVLMVL